jgi:hypothetical protein
MTVPKLQLRQLRRSHKWVILGRIGDNWWIGPYDTRKEAYSDMLGVQRFFVQYKYTEKPHEDPV